MMSAALINNVRTMIRRYERHHESGNHVLREGSQHEMARGKIDFFHETDPETNQLNTNGYSVAPGGMGKTITEGDFLVGINTMPNGQYVLGDSVLGKRALIAVPSNMLVDQWADRLLGELDEETGIRTSSVFGDRFTEDTVGVFHADLSEEEKKIALSKPIVIAVHDSIMILNANTHLNPKQNMPCLKPEDFDCVIIDEVDDKVRGDVTSRFYKDKFFPKCLILGCTATPLFRSGKSIGHYLFGGKKPISEITHQEGVMRRDIAPHVNIIVQPEINPNSIIKPKPKGWDDYSEEEQLKLIEQTGTDQALLDVIRVGRHPVTGKPLRELMQLHQTVNVEHGKYIAKKLNQEFGSKYAEAVWGATDEEMDDGLRRLIKWLLKTGELKAVVQCKLYSRGTDIPSLEMTVQHAPTLSPNKLVQFHTRASRKHDGKKTAIYLSPFIDGIDQLVIGEVLGGLYMLPPGYDFPPTEGRENTTSTSEPWPDIKGVKVYHTQRQLEMFAKEQHQRRFINGLPIKPKGMLSLEDMAKALGIDQNILRQRVYDPLYEAYEKKSSREKYIEIQADEKSDFLHVRGRMFPAWRVGLFQHKAQIAFCVDENLKPLCEYALYGRLDRVPPEVLDRDNARRLLGCNNSQVGDLWQTLQHAFFQRKPYERHVTINGIDFSYDTFGFYRNREGHSQFFIFPDALIPAYRHLHATDQETAERWAQQPALRQCKLSSWLTEFEVAEILELSPLLENPERAFVRSLFNVIRPSSRNLRVGQEREVEIGKGRNKLLVNCARRWLPSADSQDQNALCIDRSAIEWIKSELGMESTYDDEGHHQSVRPRSIPGQENQNIPSTRL